MMNAFINACQLVCLFLVFAFIGLGAAIAIGG
jgi:hypothetical protein